MNNIGKVVLAYSGGLDTSVILRWLQETYGCEVVTFTADLGQGEELEPALSAEAPSDDAPEEADLELAGLDAEEAERLKNDPRYAARAIVLPSPPPMPAAEAESEAVSDVDEAVKPSTGPVTRETRELRPSAPLTNRVLSLFSNPPVPPAPPAPPAPARNAEDEDA